MLLQAGGPRLRAQGIGVAVDRPRSAAPARQAAYSVPLDFAQGDRTHRQRSVLVHHRIVGVLPALVNETGRRATLVLDEAVTIAVAVPVDPAERRLDGRPDRVDEGQITRALEVHAGKCDEQGRASTLP